MQSKKKFIIASDHAGRELKEQAERAMRILGIEYEDLSNKNSMDDDYPDFAEKVSGEVLAKKNTLGFLSCGTGIGMSIAANKIKGIRAALCNDDVEAKLARAHNDANVLVLAGWKKISLKEIKKIIKTFNDTSFDEGRHRRRLEKIRLLENTKFSGK